MKVSIVTVVYNNKETIANTMKSVCSQTYSDLEYIIIDGRSSDGTVEIINDMIRAYPEKDITFISEKDTGIYDAMNKGITLATGNIIGILNGDDVYADKSVISTVVGQFVEKNVDCVFADLVYVRAANDDKVVRFYSAAEFDPEKMIYGWMPPHPTFFVKQEMYKNYGLYKTDYMIAADYELMVRFLVKNNISYRYIPKVLVKMRTSGVSTRGFRSNFILNKEILRACRENGLKTNVLKIYSKYFTKIFQLFRRPKKGC